MKFSRCEWTYGGAMANDITRCSEANRWGTIDTGSPELPDYRCRLPYMSYDAETWQHVESAERVVQMPHTIKFSHTFEEDEAYICYTIPYTYTNLLEWLQTIRDVPGISVEMIGRTEEGRDVPMVTVGEAGPGKPVIMLISREDGDEPTSNVAIEGMVARMADPDDEVMQATLERVFFRIVPMTAIDAVMMGNPYGGKYYMARVWFRDPPLPEIAAVKRIVEDCFTNHPVRLMGKLHGG